MFFNSKLIFGVSVSASNVLHLMTDEQNFDSKMMRFAIAKYSKQDLYQISASIGAGVSSDSGNDGELGENSSEEILAALEDEDRGITDGDADDLNTGSGMNDDEEYYGPSDQTEEADDLAALGENFIIEPSDNLK